MEGSFICLCLTACLPAVQQRPYVADFDVCSVLSSITPGCRLVIMRRASRTVQMLRMSQASSQMVEMRLCPQGAR